jgi:hypothetical protein
VKVTLANTNEVLTDTNGLTRSISCSPANYGISIEGGGYHFDPSEIQITVGPNVTNNFLAQGTNSVSGRITNSVAGIPGVRRAGRVAHEYFRNRREWPLLDSGTSQRQRAAPAERHQPGFHARLTYRDRSSLRHQRGLSRVSR